MPTQLLALLDEAKAFPLLKKQQPDALAGAEPRTFGDKAQVIDFNDYEIRMDWTRKVNPVISSVPIPLRSYSCGHHQVTVS